MQSKERRKWEKIYKKEMKDEVTIQAFYDELEGKRFKRQQENKAKTKEDAISTALKCNRGKAIAEYLEREIETLKIEVGILPGLISIPLSFAAFIVAVFSEDLSVSTCSILKSLGVTIPQDLLFPVVVLEIPLSAIIAVITSACSIYLLIHCARSRVKVRNMYLMLEALKRYEQKNAEGATLYTISVKEKTSEESQHR